MEGTDLFFFTLEFLCQVENIRRRHNYLPFIMELLKILAQEGKLTGLVGEVWEPQENLAGGFYCHMLHHSCGPSVWHS